MDGATYYRLEVEARADGATVLGAVVPAAVTVYRAPPWLGERATGDVRWRISAINATGALMARSGWSTLERR